MNFQIKFIVIYRSECQNNTKREVILNMLIKIGIYRFPTTIKFRKERRGICISILHVYKKLNTPVILTGIVFMTKYGRICFKFIGLVPLK